MSVIIRLQGLPWTASALDIRNFFQGLQIPPGGVHIIGGEKGDAFIAFVTDEDARQAMMKTYQILNGSAVQLLLSSKTEMQNVIEAARTGQVPEQVPEPARPPPVEQPKPYEDPYYKGPPAQDIRGGYREDVPKYGGPDSMQGMYMNEQQGYRDDYGNMAPEDPWAQGSAQNRYSEEGYPPENRPFGSRDIPREVPPRPPLEREIPPRDGPPFGMRNQGMPNERFEDPYNQNQPPDQQYGMYDRPPMDERPQMGDPSYDRHTGLPYGMNDPAGPMDRRPPPDARRPDSRADMRRGPEGRFSESRDGRDIRESRDGRDSREGRDRDGRDGRDRRDRSERDRSDRDRSDRDRSSRSDRSDRFERGDRGDRSDRFDRSDRSRRDQDRERRDHSEPRRDFREPRDSREPRERPPFDDKPIDQRHSPLPRPARDHPARNPSEPRVPPTRPGPDTYGQFDGNFEGNLQEFNQRPDQFPPGDQRHPDEFQGQFPPRDRGLDRPKNRFDQEVPSSRFPPDERRPPPDFENKDPDYRPDLRGPSEGPRGRGRPPMFQEQGNGFDRDSRHPDRDFRGGPPAEPGFPPRPAQQGRGRGMEGQPQGIRPPGFHDEGYPRGPNDYPKYPPEDGRNVNAQWEMDSRFPPSHGPSGAPGRPPQRPDFMEKRPGTGNGPSSGKGLLGDAPAMFSVPRLPVDRPDMQMDHDGREPNQRHFVAERSGSGQFRENFGRSGDSNRNDDFEGRQRYRGRDMDQRPARDDRGPRPLLPEHDRRRPDWGGDGGHDSRWPPEDMPRGLPRRQMDREMQDGSEDLDQLGYPPRERSQPGDDLNRKRPRQSDSGNSYAHIKNLPYTVSYSMVRRFFAGCDIPYDGLKLINTDQGKRNGTAYIRFSSEDACYSALKRNGLEMNGRTIIVHRCSQAEFDRAIDSYVPDEEEEEPEPAKRPRSDMPLQANKDIPVPMPPPGEPFIVKVNNLPLNVSIDDIKKLFSAVKVAENGAAVYMEFNSSGSFTGNACVEVQGADDYKTAMGFEGRHMGSRILRVAMGSKSDMAKLKSSQPKGDLQSSNKVTSPKRESQNEKGSEGEKGQGDEDYPFICIHLNGLPPAATFRELREFVSGLEVAPRGIQICHDGMGHPVGEGFIEFTNKKDCKEAIKRDQQNLGSNTITVKPILKADMIQRMRKARTINSRPSGPGGPVGPGGPQAGQGPQMNAKPIPPGVLKRQWVYLRCSNLPLQVTIRELLGFFNKYNPVPESIRLHYTGDGNPTGNAVVGFPTKEEASKAMTDLNGTLCRRNNVVIQPANS